MIRAKIVETDLDFESLAEREETDMVVIHHTGEADIDATAEQIHEWHQNNGWAGIGYHYVVRKNGTIERGRPEWAVGSHAYGENYHTIGIHFSGDFMEAEPTSKQIESGALLIANICMDYGIPIDRDHIVGHGELMGTSCPGTNLQALLDDGTLTGKANWYAYGDEPDTKQVEKVAETVPFVDDVVRTSTFDTEIARLARKYESNGDPAVVSDGVGDVGGVSYGAYQLASNTGAVNSFLVWAKGYQNDLLANYARVLSEFPVNSDEFINKWEEIGHIDPQGFLELQDAYISSMYYENSAGQLWDLGYDIEKHSTAMKAVLFARSVQNGVNGAVELFQVALSVMKHPDNRAEVGYSNLSYVDNEYFDRELIVAIYDFLIDECENAKANRGMFRSPNGFVNGSVGLVTALKDRFRNEREDALDML